MPNYSDLANQQMPSLADLVARLREQKAMRDARSNPGARPGDARGGQANVAIEGEDPIRAQPVNGQQLGVSVGRPTMTTDPVRVQVPGQNAHVRVQALMKQMMAQGMPQNEAWAQAVRTVQQGG